MADLELDMADMLSLEGMYKHCDDEELEVLTFTGNDDAIIGLGRISNKDVAIYSFDLLIKSLMTRNSWTEEEAMEWYGFNMYDTPPEGPVVMHIGVYQEGVERHGTG